MVRVMLSFVDQVLWPEPWAGGVSMALGIREMAAFSHGFPEGAGWFTI